MSGRRCPVCDKPAALTGPGSPFPFCSPRCKNVDLGRWFNEEYVIPGPPSAAETEPGDPVDDSPSPADKGERPPRR